MAFSLKERVTNLTPVADLQPGRYCPDLAEIGHKIGRLVWSGWSLAIVGLTLVCVTLAYQAHPAAEIKLGGGFDAPYLNLSEGGFGRPIQLNNLVADSSDGENAGRSGAVVTSTDKPTAPEELNLSYRWTRDRPILLWPGVGATPSRLSLQMAGSPLIRAGQRVELLLNGGSFGQFDLKPGLVVTKTFDFGADRLNGGSLAVEMRVKALGPVDSGLNEQYPGTYYKIDQNLYQGATGFKLYTARLEARPAAGWGLSSLSVLLSLVAALWLLYGCLAYTGLACRWAFSVAGVAAVAVGVILAVARLGLTIFTGRLALLLIVTAVLLPTLDWVGPRLFRAGRIALPGWAWQGLLVMFVIGMLGRGGGVLYPQTEVIDAPAHLKEINTILHDPNGLVKEWINQDLSRVPDQWQSQAIIPYSTVSYFYLAPVAALPIDPYISVNLFNALLDAGRVFIIFGLAMALGAGARAALVGAALYLIVPSTWLLNSWGNWPTTLSFWLATLYLLLVLVGWQRLNRPAVWLSAAFVLLLTMLAYTVTAVFMGILLYVWAVGLIFFVRRDPLARRNGVIIAGTTTGVALLAIAVYYAQFIPDLAGTLTSFDQSLKSNGSLGSFGDRSLSYYLGLYADHVTFRYGAMFVILAGLAVWLWAIFSRRPRPTDDPADLTTSEPNESILRSGSRLWLAGAWWGVFGLFGLAQWKVDMVDKQVWFVLPLAVSLAGVGSIWAWQTFKAPLLMWGSRAVVSGLMLWTTYSAASLWLERIFIKRR